MCQCLVLDCTITRIGCCFNTDYFCSLFILNPIWTLYETVAFVVLHQTLCSSWVILTHVLLECSCIWSLPLALSMLLNLFESWTVMTPQNSTSPHQQRADPFNSLKFESVDHFVLTSWFITVKTCCSPAPCFHWQLILYFATPYLTTLWFCPFVLWFFWLHLDTLGTGILILPPSHWFLMWTLGGKCVSTFTICLPSGKENVLLRRLLFGWGTVWDKFIPLCPSYLRTTCNLVLLQRLSMHQR